MKIMIKKMKASVMPSIASMALVVLFSSSSWAATLDSTLSFSSQDQSMWGTGSAEQFNNTDDPLFFGATWTESGTAGGFIGGTTAVPNPLYGAWFLCDQGDIFNTGVCGSAPPQTFNVDTTTGLQVSANTQGRIGFEMGITVDSGSVDALVNYNTQVIVPEVADITPGQFVSLNTSSALTGDSLSTQFPTMSASLSVVMEVSANFAATGCAAGLCDTASFGTGTLGGTQELISFNEDGQGGIEYFGGSGTLSDILDAAVATGLVDLPTGFPATIDIPAPGTGNLASITAHLPQPNATGGLDATGTMLTAQGQDNLLDFSLDVDNLISLASIGTGGLFGGGEDLGAGFGLSYDLINVQLGPQIDLVQSFEFTPTLYVDLVFSQPVNVTGHGRVTSLTGVEWDALPTMAFDGGITTVTPTFYLGYMMGNQLITDAGELYNELFLDVDGNIRVDLLTATFSTPFGDETIGLGNLIDESFDLFSTPAFYSERFAMAGFDSIVGASFDVQVPEPATLILMGIGLMAIRFVRHRKVS